jgi:hypothetical protein
MRISSVNCDILYLVLADCHGHLLSFGYPESITFTFDKRTQVSLGDLLVFLHMVHAFWIELIQLPVPKLEV